MTPEVARLTSAGSPQPAPIQSPAARGNDTAARQLSASRSADFSEALRFSAHALKRLEQRGIALSGADVDRLETAMDKVQAKGGKDSLILMDDLALIVSVKNRTVVTALDPKSQKQGVFTNIDSVVIG